MDTLLIYDLTLPSVDYVFSSLEGSTWKAISRCQHLRRYVASIVERNPHIAFTDVVWRTANDGAVILEARGKSRI